MPVEQGSAGEALAPVLSSLEMGAALGTMDKSLTTPQIGEARSKLVGEAAQKRFDRMMELFEIAGSHAMRKTIFPLAERFFPSCGENTQVLYLLMLGAGSHRDGSYLDSLAMSYKYQLTLVAKNLEKAPGELTLVDLGEALINGSFQPEEL